MDKSSHKEAAEKTPNLKRSKNFSKTYTASTIRHDVKRISMTKRHLINSVSKIWSCSLGEFSKKKYIYKPKELALSQLSVRIFTFDLLLKLRLCKTNRWNIFRYTWTKVKESHKISIFLLISRTIRYQSDWIAAIENCSIAQSSIAILTSMPNFPKTR